MVFMASQRSVGEVRRQATTWENRNRIFINARGSTGLTRCRSLHASFSDGLLTRCVAFAEAQITGLQLIERARVEYQAQQFGSMGSAMCQLDREPSTVPSGCFGSGPYWQYFHRQGEGWRASTVGASSSVLHDGDVDGWRYAAGTNQTPGNVAFAAVCGAPPAPAAASRAPRPTASVRPAPNQATAAAAAPTATTSLEALAEPGTPLRIIAVCRT